MFEQNLKAVLKKYKGKPIKLSQLYQEVHIGIFTEEEIQNNLSNQEIMKKFMESLNGAIIEETVSTIDMTSYDGTDFGTIKVDYGSAADPMLMVKSSNTIPVEAVRLSKKDNLTIITIPDLHLDKGCYNPDGTLNKALFEERLFSFIQFRDGLIEKMKQEGIEIAGIVFTGDILDVPEKLKGNPTKISAYATDVIDSIKKVRLIAQTDEMSELRGDESYFTAFIAGNHDMRLEQSVFEEVMEEFSSYIGKDSISLGLGSARIKVGEQFLAFMHHNSLDPGVFMTNSMQLREKRNELTFQFDNYLEMCNSYYNSREFQELLSHKDSSISEVSFLMTKMNEKLLKENPKLYYFYLPYITPSSDNGNISRNNNIKNDISFFENFIGIENGRICCNRENKPKVDDYIVFARSPGFITKLDNLAQEIAKRTNNPEEIEEPMRYFMLPQIGRNDVYMPVSYMLAHFHAQEIEDSRVHHHDGETPVVAFEEPVTTIQARKKVPRGENGYARDNSGGDWKKEAIAYEQKMPFDSIPKSESGRLMGEKSNPKITPNPYFYEDETKYDFDPKRDNMVFGVRLYDIKLSNGKISHISARNIQAETILIQRNPYHLVSVMFTDGETYNQEISSVRR
ncbi:MAG: hypothetical protein IJN90_04260 [Bacilli bacterium]|nr:hypothetical protein [Bacilli bacterium]